MKGVFLVVLAARCLGASDVPSYTNDDLDALRGLRHQTGALSEVATPAPASEGDEASARAATERYWRREAERHRDRLRAQYRKADALREDIAARRGRPGVRPASDPQLQAWERRLAAIVEQIREAELRFEERARREHALPGWLR